jgi:thioredoxin-related protein
MKRLFLFFTTLSLCLAVVLGGEAQGHKRHKTLRRKTGLAQQSVKKTATGEYVPVHAYDPKRNAEQDIRDAVAEAERTGQRVLLEVGGEWCIWCHRMDEFFEKHPELLELREKNFIMVKINFSEENKNEPLLSRYPPVAGYPHIFVLDRDGKLLHSQNTGDLEEGKSYNLDKFMAFLKEWAAPPSEAK